MSFLPKRKEASTLPDTDVIGNKEGHFQILHLPVQYEACGHAHHS